MWSNISQTLQPYKTWGVLINFTPRNQWGWGWGCWWGCILLICQNATMRVYGACNKRYCILSSKPFSTMSSLLQLPAGSQQAATSARIFETRLLMSESRDFYIIVCNLVSMKKHLYKYLLWSILFWIYVSAHIMAGYIVCSAVFFVLKFVLCIFSTVCIFCIGCRA